MVEVPESSAAAAAAMARLQAVLTDPDERERFLAKPEDTLRRGKVPLDDIPAPVLDVLKGLSPEELELIVRLQTTLVKEGLFIDVPGVGSVGFL
jgi:hypothetical protein